MRSSTQSPASSKNGHAHHSANGKQTPRAGRDLASMAVFAKNFFTHPKMLGSIIPSSRFLIRRLLDQIDWQQARVVVEYGPGVGNITSEVLHRMAPNGQVIAIDTNAEFIDFLRRKLRDPRFTAVHGSAADVAEILAQHGIQHADHVITGIPFSVMPPEIRDRVVKSTRQVLSPSGSLLVYQFSPAVRASLDREFEDVSHQFEWLNILPAHVFRCRARVNGNGHSLSARETTCRA
jgi:phospholipid N-methyltransferase